MVNIPTCALRDGRIKSMLAGLDAGCRDSQDHFVACRVASFDAVLFGTPVMSSMFGLGLCGAVGRFGRMLHRF